MTELPPTIAGAPAESDPTTALGRSLAERQRPLGARRSPMVGASVAQRPGSLGRRSFEFSLAAGLSLSARRQMGVVSLGLDVDGLPVIPPAEWDDSLLDTIEAPRTGNATLDHIILTQLRTKAASKRRMPARGLRSAVQRHGTRAGRDTGPGSSARRLRPQTAPMGRDLEIQRLVSGDGGDTRPRAPRSGPSTGGGPRRAPGSYPGKEARGRSGRPAPWLDLRGAQGQAPPVAAVPGGGSGGRDPAPPFAAASGGGSAGRDEAPDRPDPASRRALVAEVASRITGIGGADAGASGLHLARSSAALPGRIDAPRSSAASVAATAAAAAARLAASTARVVAGASVRSPAVAQTVREEADSSTRSAAPTIQATPSRARATDAPQPSLVSALLESPPALSLSSLPRRSVSPGRTAPAHSAGAQGRPTSGGDGVAAGAAGFGHVAGGATQSPVLLGGGGPNGPTGTAGLPVVGPAGFSGESTGAAVGAPSTGNSPGVPSPARRSVSGRPERGLGSVARLVSPDRPDERAHPTSTHGRPSEPGRPRAVRSLPDLAAPTATTSAGLVALGVGRELLANLAPPALPSTSLAGSPPAAAASAGWPAAVSTARIPASLAEAAPTGRLGNADVAGRTATASPVPLPTPDLPVTPPAIVPADPGERFTHTIERHGGAKPRPLPQRFEPIARAILPRPDRVRIAADPASRAALADAGKVAATAGDVVHLARPLDSSPASLDILAHELTHVAHPSPLVRFFDDDRHSKEEALAREIGQVMAKAPVGSPPTTAPPAPPPTPGGSSGSSSAGAGGSGSTSSAPPLPSTRAAGTSSGRQAGVAAGSPPGLIDPTPDRGGSSGPDRSAGTGANLASAGIDIDRLLDALEARVVRELERRGRRWPRPI